MKPFVALLLACTATAAVAQTKEPDFSADRVHADVAFLADDVLEGRNAGERGYDIAAAYVAARFRALGLKPGTADGYYQQVPFVRSSVKPGTRGRMTIGGQAFDSGTDIVMGPSARFPDQAVDADVVFVGYGIESKANGFDDYAGLDVRGKVVAMIGDIPEGGNTEINAHLASDRGITASEKGAIGTIFLHTPKAEKTVPWERMRAYGTAPRLYWLDQAGKPYTPAPGLSVGGMAGMKASTALFAGAKRPLADVFAEAAKPGGRPKGFPLAQKVRFERHSTLENLKSPNVLAVLPGSDRALASEYVVLMAHLDHDGINADAKGADKIMNGAMDNAAGTATMLEVARAFATSGVRPKRSILFAAVTAEEDGLLGSEYLAKNPVVTPGKVVGVVNLDMPILTYDFSDVTAFGAEHSTLGPLVAAAAAKAGVKLSPDPMPEEGIFTRSDHYMYVVEGIPAVMLATGFGGEGDARSRDFLKNHYHQVSDDLNLPIDWNAGAKFARVNYLIARDIADAPQSPRWYEGNFFGDTFAKGQPKAPRK